MTADISSVRRLVAFLLRSPPRKSYSGRMSSAAVVLEEFRLGGGFFIAFAFAARGYSRADDADSPSSIHVHNGKHTAFSERPSNTKRSSPSECRGSATMRPCESPKAFAAS